MKRKNPTILMADDDLDDFFLAREALEESGVPADFRMVPDGEELMDYLLRRGKYADEKDYPFPALILLDLNMPRKDGREALLEIKQNKNLRGIPVVVLTTSEQEKDISYCYQVGANSFMTKPVTFGDLVEMMRKIGNILAESGKMIC
jgi:CheY-like chemotaxis protein